MLDVSRMTCSFRKNTTYLVDKGVLFKSYDRKNIETGSDDNNWQYYGRQNLRYHLEVRNPISVLSAPKVSGPLKTFDISNASVISPLPFRDYRLT